MKLSVIIPSYNEEERLPKTLKKIRQYLNRQNYEHEVIVVDDGSKDKTSEVVAKLIDGWSGFRIISYTPNRGKGFAVKTGMLAAKGDWQILMDADNSTDLAEVKKLFKYARLGHIKDTGSTISPARKSEPTRSASLSASGGTMLAQPARVTLSDQGLLNGKFEVIIGSRYLKADSIKVKQPLGRRIVSRIGNLMIRTILGIHSVDTQCGFKMFSKSAAGRTFPLQTIERWGFDMEILAIAINKGYKIKEVPVDWYDDATSHVKKSAAFRTLRELFEIKWKMMTGKYSG